MGGEGRRASKEEGKRLLFVLIENADTSCSNPGVYKKETLGRARINGDRLHIPEKIIGRGHLHNRPKGDGPTTLTRCHRRLDHAVGK